MILITLFLPVSADFFFFKNTSLVMKWELTVGEAVSEVLWMTARDEPSTQTKIYGRLHPWGEIHISGKASKDVIRFHLASDASWEAGGRDWFDI